jgi:rhamnosyltransferase
LSVEVLVRRVAFYLFYDPQGQVDDFVLHTLSHLRPHVEHVFVVSNSPLDDTARGRLESVADTVWERDNTGFDVWAYKSALEEFEARHGEDGGLAAYDELLLTNCTYFGPVGSFDDLFARTEADPGLDFWGISEHGEVEPHPFLTKEGRIKKIGTERAEDPTSTPVVDPLTEDRLERHLQTHWLACRRRLFTSDDWARYWGEMPPITSYLSSVVLHEARFTPHFAGLGYRYLVAFPGDERVSEHPIMDNAEQLLRDGCPIVKRRLFFHDPLYNEQRALDGRRMAQLMGEAGYPLEAMYSNLARTSVPRSLVTNLAMLEVLPDTDLGYDPARPLRIVAVAHIYYPEMTDEILDRLDHLPAYDLVVTTADEQRREAIRAVLERRGRAGDVRVVASNKGRDISAFFIDCRDVIDSDEHDLVVKVHSKKSPQDDPTVGEMFKRHLFENLLSSPGYVANVLRLFQQHSSLGMVVPPVHHIGYPTLGISWFQNKERAQELADQLGITVPFDTSTPVAAYGSMFIARPHTLRKLAAAGFSHDDFPDDAAYRDGALSHVVERLMAYSVLSSGYHVREVMNPHLAAVGYSYLEYRGVALGEALGPRPRQAVKRVKKLKGFRKAAVRAGLEPVGIDPPQRRPGGQRAPAPEPTPVGGPLRAVGRRARDTVRRTTTRGGPS